MGRRGRCGGLAGRRLALRARRGGLGLRGAGDVGERIPDARGAGCDPCQRGGGERDRHRVSCRIRPGPLAGRARAPEEIPRAFRCGGHAALDVLRESGKDEECCKEREALKRRGRPGRCGTRSGCDMIDTLPSGATARGAGPPGAAGDLGHGTHALQPPRRVLRGSDEALGRRDEVRHWVPSRRAGLGAPIAHGRRGGRPLPAAGVLRVPREPRARVPTDPAL